MLNNSGWRWRKKGHETKETSHKIGKVNFGRHPVVIKTKRETDVDFSGHLCSHHQVTPIFGKEAEKERER